MEKHNVFISFHSQDIPWKNEFERRFEHLFISKSVNKGDIDSDNSSEYVKRLINEGYIDDASVVIVLIGAKTYCRRHVDWEIYAALDVRVGGRAGLLGICLPTNPDYPGPTYNATITPARFVDNQRSGYANYYDWTDEQVLMAARIETAFLTRIEKADKADNRRIQLSNNLCN
jgi:hypothetical protein